MTGVAEDCAARLHGEVGDDPATPPVSAATGRAGSMPFRARSRRNFSSRLINVTAITIQHGRWGPGRNPASARFLPVFRHLNSIMRGPTADLRTGIRRHAAEEGQQRSTSILERNTYRRPGTEQHADPRCLPSGPAGGLPAVPERRRNFRQGGRVTDDRRRPRHLADPLAPGSTTRLIGSAPALVPASSPPPQMTLGRSFRISQTSAVHCPVADPQGSPTEVRILIGEDRAMCQPSGTGKVPGAEGSVPGQQAA